MSGLHSERGCGGVRVRLDGPLTCHALVQILGFVKTFLIEIDQVFPQQLYPHVTGTN